MPFSYSTFRRPTPVRSKVPALAVGRRVLVARSEDGPPHVALTDDLGTIALASLADGHEVEILAWRPRGAATRYRVRSTGDGLEGWLGVENLRGKAPVVLPSPAPVAPVRRPVPLQAKVAPPAKKTATPGRQSRRSAN